MIWAIIAVAAFAALLVVAFVMACFEVMVIRQDFRRGEQELGKEGRL